MMGRTMPVSTFVRRCLSSGRRRTALFQLHKELGGQMVDFAGWEMPVQYSSISLKDSVLHTRKAASLFDVSHMLQTQIHGAHRVEFLESLVPADLAALKEGSGTLSIFTNENGGIEDDLILTKDPSSFFVVSNAACAYKDLPLLETTAAEWRGKGKDVAVEVLEDRSLIALQGPKVASLLAGAALEGCRLSELYFMHSAVDVCVLGIGGCRVSRCGYTGEDGVEISVPSSSALELSRRLLRLGGVEAAGLGARDALRVEAGLCLYGKEMDETTTPAEAGLAWLLAKRRREEGNFPGAAKILSQLKAKSWEKRRVGLLGQGRPGREGAELLAEDGSVVGTLTSGLPSPTLKANVAMAYVRPDYAKIGTPLKLRHSPKAKSQQSQEVQVAKMPFVPTHYYLPSKSL